MPIKNIYFEECKSPLWHWQKGATEMFYMTVANSATIYITRAVLLKDQGTSVRKYESIVAILLLLCRKQQRQQQFEGHCSVTNEVLHHWRLQRSNSLCRSWTAGSDAHNKSTVGKHHDTSYYRHTCGTAMLLRDNVFVIVLWLLTL